MALPSPLAELPSRHADEPFVATTLQFNKLGRRGLRQVDVRLLGHAIGDLEDTSARPVNAIFLVALANIAPVQNRHRTVRALAELDAAKPGIVRL